MTTRNVMRSAAFLALLSAVACERPAASSLIPRGPGADQIGSLWNLFFVVATIVWIAVVIVLLIALFRRTRDPLQTDEGSVTTSVGIATAVTVLTLIVLLVGSVRTGSAISKLDGTPLEIEITGHQWWWEIKYPDPKVPSNIVTTANEIHIPVGMPVKLTLLSADVIHSFWVPDLMGKRDLIPSHRNELWIRADKAGLYRGQCAEFCGMQHAHMILYVVAEPVPQFRRWLSLQRSDSQPPSDPTQLRGQNVFLNSACAMCHTIRGTSAAATNGPDLTHLASRNMIGAGSAPNNEGNLGGWISDPGSIKPGTTMPPNPLAPEDLKALIAYLRSLR